MKRSHLIGVLVILLLIYTGSYLRLTLRGSYEPVTIGLNSHNTYAWAPEHFVRDYKWSRIHLVFYLPLYCLDVQFWHTRAAVTSGRYPVDVPPRLVPTKVDKNTHPVNLPATSPTH